MKWAMWTFCWWAGVQLIWTLDEYVEFRMGRLPKKPSDSNFTAVVLFVIWIIGMVKFW